MSTDAVLRWMASRREVRIVTLSFILTGFPSIP